MSRDLFDAGIKCGNVAFPAVPTNEATLRFTLNARHTAADLGRTMDVLTRVDAKHDILHRSAEEVVEIGNRGGGPSAARK
jgi:hypothetical protein